MSRLRTIYEDQMGPGFAATQGSRYPERLRKAGALTVLAGVGTLAVGAAMYDANVIAAGIGIGWVGAAGAVGGLLCEAPYTPGSAEQPDALSSQPDAADRQT